MKEARGTDTAPDPLTQTRRWLERAVIGLELCPFAAAVHRRSQIRWVLSEAVSTPALQRELQTELQWLAATDPSKTDTTLIVHPQALQDFGDYNDFLDVADATLQALALDGILQIASFHPQYRFAGTRASDPGNLSNRSPYPTLHLLREASVARAVAAFAHPESIYKRNIETLRALGTDGWRRLLADDAADAIETAASDANATQAADPAEASPKRLRRKGTAVVRPT